MITPKTPSPTAREEREAYELVELRDGGICQLCRRSECGPVQMDHRKNRSQGGLTVVENVQQLGMLHHTWKTDHPKEAEAEGWGVPGWASPLTYPARRWVRNVYGTVRLRWVLYRHDGRYVIIPDGEAVRRIEEGRMYDETTSGDNVKEEGVRDGRI